MLRKILSLTMLAVFLMTASAVPFAEAGKKHNPCNPCDAKKMKKHNPCNPCDAKKMKKHNPCNPCDAKKM